jgi:mannosyltransferase OCH1-like enzyme
MIPKIIHQIWIGYEKPSQRMEGWFGRWKEMHPEWEYKLWDNDAFDEYQREYGFITDKSVFLTCNSMSELSDILRYELLHRFGGFYVDADQRCLKPFDGLCESLSDINKDFMISHENEHDYVCTGVLASMPNHHVTEKLLYDLPLRAETHIDTPANDKYGPGYATKTVDREYWIDSMRELLFPAYGIDAYEHRFSTEEELSLKFPKAYAAHMYDSSWSRKLKTRQKDKFYKFALDAEISGVTFMQEVIISVGQKRIDLEESGRYLDTKSYK